MSAGFCSCLIQVEFMFKFMLKFMSSLHGVKVKFLDKQYRDNKLFSVPYSSATM